MQHTPHISTTATPRNDARTPEPSPPTFGEMLEEVIDLSGGFVVALLPALLLAVRRAGDHPLRRPAGHPSVHARGAAGRDRRGGRHAAIPAGALAAKTAGEERLAPGRPCRQRAAIDEDERSVAGPGSGSVLNAAASAGATRSSATRDRRGCTIPPVSARRSPLCRAFAMRRRGLEPPPGYPGRPRACDGKLGADLHRSRTADFRAPSRARICPMFCVGSG